MDREEPPCGPIVLISFSVIADDPRVRRQGDALHDAGWKVTAVGLAGRTLGATGVGDRRQRRRLRGCGRRPRRHDRGNADVRGISRPRPPHRPRTRRAKRRSIGRCSGSGAGVAPHESRWISRRREISRVSPAIALRRYWGQPHFAALYAAARDVPGRVFVANDWNTLPVAARLAEERGGIFCYDAHEFAVEEYEDRALWRWTQKPWVAAIEGMFVKRAAWVSTVSRGIAVAMQRRYGLAEEPFVVRNAPRFVEDEPHPTGEEIVVHYHGGLASLRGLEEIIDSVALWKPDRRLRIRGMGPDEYVASLRRRIDQAGLAARIEAPCRRFP
ncbi:MAG: hypothetical protein MZW92_53085 [Comamonadaceae bacterium]|nr:hypothetical protein [Comamonadaceae bacterium]